MSFRLHPTADHIGMIPSCSYGGGDSGEERSQGSTKNKNCYLTALLGKSGAFSDLAVQVFGLLGWCHCHHPDGSQI